MASIVILGEAQAEIDELYEVDIDAAATIEVLLESLEEDDATLEDLCVVGHHFQYEPPFEVKRFGEMQKRGKNVYSLKIRNEEGALLSYRVLVAYHGQQNRYYVIGVAGRDISYEVDHEYFQALIARYEAANIPTYK